MNLYPLAEVAENAGSHMNEGATVYQQWLCAHCRVKQTMSEPNLFYTSGKCEECGLLTDIVKDGCNFAVVMKRR
jgi:hypothetical protein